MTANHNSTTGGAKTPQPKQAAVIDDDLFPMPRAVLAARDILDQAGAPKDVVLQRDYNSPIDHVFNDDEMVDLRDGNVFKTLSRCAPTQARDSHAKPKLAFVVDDVWEVTVTAHQTGRSLKRLVGLPDNAELFRDFESLHDQPVRDDDAVQFRDGPVFTAKTFSLAIKVNNNAVSVAKRRLTGLEIKEAAIAQGVNIQTSFVLYPLDKDGNLGPAIPDAETVILHECDAFRCVAPDDNS
jgi:hypothetical protein